jgi:hypothetical protein
MTKRTLQQFEWSVRALAQDSTVQLELYPSFAEVADELALEFDEHYRRLDLDLLRLAQRQAVAALNDALDDMSGPDHAELWEIEALDRAEWHHIRTLARALIHVMGGSAAAPPAERCTVYVASPRAGTS